VHLICDGIEAMQPPPALVVIDSIQTMQSPELSSAPGSITQVCDYTAIDCNALCAV
jgi:predicted ATP-dependent serine protease